MCPSAINGRVYLFFPVQKYWGMQDLWKVVMEIIFLGTAAAEGWPALFCECGNCMKAMKAGGKNIRTRSSVMMGDRYKVDFPPETLVQMQREKMGLSGLEHLFITHQHSDHLEVEELFYKASPYFSHTSGKPLYVYGSEVTVNKIKAVCKLSMQESDPEDRLEKMGIFLREITPGNEFKAGSLNVIPLEADHSPGSLIFLFADKGNVILYGNDTGIFPESAWKILSGFRLDMAVLDCTTGGLKTANRGHMGIDGVSLVVERMRRENMLKKDCRIFATHFSHNGGLLHRELEERLKAVNVRAAFDGLRVKI